MRPARGGTRARHAARRPDGSYTYAGWPKYAEGILTAKEIENVVRRNERDFPFERRAPRLLEVIKGADPDVFSLVECDEYEAFWRGRLEELGYGSVWHKRPRASAKPYALEWLNAIKDMQDIHSSREFVETIRRPRRRRISL